MNGLCVGSQNATGVLPAGTAIVLVPCASVSTAQWQYEASSGQFSWGNDATLCLDAGTSVSCLEEPYSGYAYCDAALSFGERASDLIARLQPTEAASMLSASNNGVKRLGIPRLTYGEALHGVLSGCGAPYTDNITGYTSTGCPTSFPTGLALGAAFNRTLWSSVGNVIGQEARALFNQGGIANLVLFTPDVNPFRDVRWGRGYETPGEDGFLCGEYGAAYVAALQAEQGGYLRAVSMVKHFSAYDQEGNGGVHDRTRFCAPAALDNLVEYFWPAFKATLQKGGAGGVMCSANGVEGRPSCVHSEWNIGILREEWGFEGFMVTDGNGVGYLYETYGNVSPGLNCEPGATGPTNACQLGLRGGVDVELGETLNNFALAAIADGNITWADVNTALSHSLPFLFALGLADPPSLVPWSALGPSDVDTPAHRQLSLEAARQSIVLLRNAPPPGGQHPLLPLTLQPGQTIAVIGPNADNAQTLLANYHGTNVLVESHTPLAALRARAAAAGANLTYTPGCANALCQDGSGIQAAVSAASAADAVILFMGLAPSLGGPNEAAGWVEGEELDRVNTTLPGFQEDLIAAVLAAQKTTVLVLIRGGPVSLSDTAKGIPAILDSAYPGQLGGDALSDVLLGDVSPSGKLTTTIYPASFVSTRDITDYNFTSGDGITYQYYKGTPDWPFGFGLSYTNFSFTWLEGGASPPLTTARVGARAWSPAAPPPAFGVNITNTGAVISDVSALAFLQQPYAPSEGPLSELFDFQRVAALAPGETVTLFFTIPYDVAASSPRDGRLALTIEQDTTFRIAIGHPGTAMIHRDLTITVQ